MILLGQIFAKELERRKVYRASSEMRMNEWKPPGEASGVETAKCLVLAHAKLLRAKGEHRRKAGLEVEAAPFDLAEMGDELCGDRALLADESSKVGQKLAIRNEREIHGDFRIAREISQLGGPA